MSIASLPSEGALVEDYTEVSATQLVAMITGTERDQGFALLMHQYETVIFAIVLRRIRNREAAQDLTQDVFIQILRKIDQLKDPERLPGWIKQIAVRMAINASVRNKEKGFVSFDDRLHTSDNQLDIIDNGSNDGDLHLEYEGEERDMYDILNGLCRNDRRALSLFYIKEKSLKEMADILRVPIGTVKRRLHSARNRFRKEVRQLGLTEHDFSKMLH